ncbi:MAG TPA: histidine phosphatase family protein [Acidimicrobiales bacterium]|jgi:broad specificity phosphatase PhoE|nr:histidine phosphatase family protein [Acidimicrobiales bacterium]
MLILVRHGRTAANAAGLLQGRLDHPLDQHGRWQAECIAAALPNVDRVVSSPLLRATQTARALGRSVEVDERWIELDYGNLDGCRLAEVAAEVWERWRWDLDFVPAGGESQRELGARVHEACEELLAKALEVDIVVVSHVSPIKAAVAWALGAGVESAWRSYLDQGSISRIAGVPSRPMLRSFNETWHLTGPATPAPA